MKDRNVGMAFLVALAIGLVLSAGSVSAKGANAAPAMRANQQLPQQKPNKAETFTGTLTKSRTGSFVLQVGGTTYRLENASEASKYLGKRVKVTGSLDTASETIHVTSIQPVM